MTARLAWHQPGNAIGWLMLAAPVTLLLIFASQGYVAQAYRPGHHALPVLGPAALVVAQQFFVFFTVFRAIHLLPDHQLAQVENPSGSLAWSKDVVLLFFAGLAGGWITALSRQQLKWLMSGAAVCGVFIIAAIVTNTFLWAVLTLGAAALPVSIGVGILKYRLYDIDRTLAYALVTGLLVGVYAGLVLLATQVLRFSSPVAVAASTLAAAALFNPVRRQVQRAVDRRFNRARYAADAAADAFAARLAGAVALPEVGAGLVAVIDRALEPAHLAVWLADGER
jgi:hypothetical protein